MNKLIKNIPESDTSSACTFIKNKFFPRYFSRILLEFSGHFQYTYFVKHLATVFAELKVAPKNSVMTL